MHIHPANKMFKRFQESHVVRKKLWMLKFDRCHDHQPRMIVPEIVIELIGFIDKVLAFPYAIISTKARHDCANLTRWIKPRLNKYERKHRCCRSFAMDPTDREH